MAYTTQYIGSRYVPLFAEPAEWDSTRTYEPLTVVMHDGNSYTSRQYVPVGIEITNEKFWALTGNYNAQVEQYRKDVSSYQQTVDSIAAAIPSADFNAASTVKKYIDDSDSAISAKVDGIAQIMPSSSFSSTSTVKKYIDDNDNAIQQTVDALASTYQNKMLVIGDSYSDYQLSGDLKNDSSLWWYRVASVLNLTPSKYAKSGAGYVHASDGITFDTLATKAISEITDKDKYRYVFLYGGLNDIRLDVALSDLDAALKTLLPKLRNAFPSSTIIVMGCNTFISQNTNSNGATQPIFTRKIYENARAFDCAFIKADTWLLGWASQFNTYEHPNQYGEDRIAGFVLNAIYGTGYDPGIQPDSIQVNSNWTLANADSIEVNASFMTNETLYLSLQIKITTQPTNDKPPTIRFPWNMSTSYAKTAGMTLTPVTMRIGSTLYNDLYAIVGATSIIVQSQNWPTIGTSAGHIYLNAAIPLI